MTWISETIARHKAGEPAGVTSVCSAHPLVIEAAMRLCLAEGEAGVLIEATSNQVDQTGGYTGMTPADFRDFVGDIADRVGLARDLSCSAAIIWGRTAGRANRPSKRWPKPRY